MGNNSESMKARVAFLYPTHHQDVFYITVKYHDNIPKGFQVMEQTELPFLYVTYRQDVIYITVKYHDNIPKGIQVMERT